MVELSLVVQKSRRKRKIYHKVQLGRWRLAIRRKKCHSKGTAVVQEVTQRECGSATALCLKEQPVRVETHQ